MAKYIHKARAVQRQARTHLLTIPLARLLILFIIMKIPIEISLSRKYSILTINSSLECVSKAQKDTDLENSIWVEVNVHGFHFATIKVTKQVTFEKYSSFTLIRLQSSND